MRQPEPSRSAVGWRATAAVLLMLLGAGCANTPAVADTPRAAATQSAPASPATSPAKPGLPDVTFVPGLVQTATQPLNDFNLMRSEIAPVLLAAQKVPYAEPAGHSCTTLATELQALNAVLGPDIDASPTAAVTPTLVERAVDAVGQTALGTVKSTVNSVVDGVVPFRSWVRRLSGAEEHSSAMAAAIGAGTLRRAYLKGWAEGTGCVIQWTPPDPAASVPQGADGSVAGGQLSGQDAHGRP